MAIFFLTFASVKPFPFHRIGIFKYIHPFEIFSSNKLSEIVTEATITIAVETQFGAEPGIYHAKWNNIWGFVCQKQVSRAGTRNYTPEYLWDVIDMLPKSQNTSVPYATMHLFVTEMCTYVHISVTKWCIVGCTPNVLWDLWDGFITCPCPWYVRLAPPIHFLPIFICYIYLQTWYLLYDYICKRNIYYMIVT